MRRTSILLTLAASAVFGAVACSGGTGTLPAFFEGWDDDKGERNRREVPPDTTDPPLVSQEKATGQTDPSPMAGGLVCSGTFACTITAKGQTATVNVSLQEKNGVCMAGDAILDPNGTIRSARDGGGSEGTWSGGGSTLTVTSDEGTVTCVRISSSGGTSSSSSSSSSGAPSEGTGGGKTVVDASVRPTTDGGGF